MMIAIDEAEERRREIAAMTPEMRQVIHTELEVWKLENGFGRRYTLSTDTDKAIADARARVLQWRRLAIARGKLVYCIDDKRHVGRVTKAANDLANVKWLESKAMTRGMAIAKLVAISTEDVEA